MEQENSYREVPSFPSPLPEGVTVAEWEPGALPYWLALGGMELPQRSANGEEVSACPAGHFLVELLGP